MSKLQKNTRKGELPGAGGTGGGRAGKDRGLAAAGPAAGVTLIPGFQDRKEGGPVESSWTVRGRGPRLPQGDLVLPHCIGSDPISK